MDGMDTNGLDWVSILLVIVGAFNWGIVGVTALTGESVNGVQLLAETVFLPDVATTVANVVYVLVGLAGLYFIYTSYKIRRGSRRATQQTGRSVEQGTE